MSLHSRSQKIDKVAKADSTRLIHTSKLTNHIVYGYAVKSLNNDKAYQVTLKYSKVNGKVNIEAELVDVHSFDMTDKQNVNGRWVHKANLGHTLSYHILGVLKKRATEKGKEVHFNSTLELAKKRGGEVVRVDNLNGGSVWVSFKDAIKPVEKMTLAERRELMRGPVEMGIE